MKQFTILAAALTALAAMTLTATAVHARCTVGDITMTKSAPAGNLNLSRTDIPRTSAVIHFDLPSDCPITDPPLKACVNVWDTGYPGEIPVDSAPYDPMNPETVKTVIRPSGGWESGGFHMVCNPFFLDDFNSNPRAEITLLISVRNTDPGDNQPNNLVLVMHNPTRYLKIPID